MYVAMLHSVGSDQSNWVWNWLSISSAHFETLCKYLHDNQYTTHHLNEWYEYQDDAGIRDRKKIVLTFDDGYLDNLLVAFPIMKKYGIKGTIFVNPEFVNPSENITEARNNPLGFLSWGDLRALEADHLIDIQSHTMSHNFYWKSDRMIDLYTGQPDYHWLMWNLHPAKKPFSMHEDATSCIPAGYPIFEYDRALRIRRYLPDDDFLMYCSDVYQKSTFEQKSALSVLINDLQRQQERIPGRYETDKEMESRYRYELFESKRILEEKLNKSVDYLCWPGGGYNELSLQLAEEAGYKASTYGSSDRHDYNQRHKSYKRISRFGLGSFVQLPSGFRYENNPNYLVRLFKARTGSRLTRIFLKMQKEILKSSHNMKSKISQ